MGNLGKMNRVVWIAWAMGLLAFVGASAEAAPIQFSITDLGDVSGRGLDNDGNVIAAPIRNIVGEFDRYNRYFVASDSLYAVDGTGDGRLLINGAGAFNSPNRHTYQTYVYSPGDSTGSPPPNATLLRSPNDNETMRAGGVDINAHGEVVGGIGPPYGQYGGPVKPFYVSAGSSTMQYLNDLIPPNSGWKLTDVYSINDRSQILALGEREDRTTSVLLLTPIEPVPEPGAWAVFGLAAAAFAWRRRRAA
jgi:PEP-CTERM motif